MPHRGIKVAVFFPGDVLCTIAINGFSYRKNFLGTFVFSLLLWLFFLLLLKKSVEGKNVMILYESGGIPGVWKVADQVVAVDQFR